MLDRIKRREDIINLKTAKTCLTAYAEQCDATQPTTKQRVKPSKERKVINICLSITCQ